MVLRHLVSPRPELGASGFKDSFEISAREIPSAKEPMVDVQTDWFFGRHVRLFYQNRVFFFDSSGKEQIRLYTNHWFFGRRFSTSDSWSGHSACIKTNGFKALDLSMPRAGMH